MAKQSIVAVIKAKPGAKSPNHGKTSHLPLICNVRKNCTNEAVTITGPFHKRVMACDPCKQNPPQERSGKLITKLKSMGLV